MARVGGRMGFEFSSVSPVWGATTTSPLTQTTPEPDMPQTMTRLRKTPRERSRGLGKTWNGGHAPTRVDALLSAFLPALIAGVHGIGGGVWIGAVGFNLFVLTPRAQTWFRVPAEHEDFVFSVVQGLRWPVLGGALAVVGTGLWRWRFPVGTPFEAWHFLMLGKLGCALISVALFGWVTIRLWPQRACSTEAELPSIRKRFFALGVGIVASNTLAAALGVLASQLPH